MMRIAYAVIAVFILSGATMAQTGNITVAPDTTYFQRDTFITVNISADGGLAGVKAMRLDIDIDPSVAVVDTALAEMGSMFKQSDTVTFYFHYYTPDSARFTVDIAVLSGLETVDGPGLIVTFPLNTVGFGETDIAIGDYRIRDVENNPIYAGVQNGWLKVCQFVGDMNADNRIDIGDLTYLIVFLYLNGPDPNPWASGDVNCDGLVDIGDLTHLIGYLYIDARPICEVCL
jgi:hypothetical protein